MPVPVAAHPADAPPRPGRLGRRRTGGGSVAGPAAVVAAALLCVVLGSSPIARAASGSSRQGAATCAAAWARDSWPSGGDGTRSSRGWALLAVGNPGNVDEGAPAVWTRRDRAFAGIAARTVRGRYRLWVCTVTTAQMKRGRPALSVLGRPRTLESGARPVAAAVADRWISWATTRSGRSGFVLHRQTLGRRRSSHRTFRGTLIGLTMTRDGTAAVSTLHGGRQRIWRWSRAGSTTAMRPARAIPNVKRYWNYATVVTLWDPDSFLLSTSERERNLSREDTLAPLSSDRIVATSRYQPCRTWRKPVYDERGQQRRAGALRVTLTSSAAWSYRAVIDEEGPGSVERLEACDPESRMPVLAVDAGFIARDSGMTYDALVSIATVGGAVFATGALGDGYTGSGSTSSPYAVGYVRRDGRWVSVGRHVATPGGAAWVFDNQVWALDALGTRPVAPVTEHFKGLRLRRDGTALELVSVPPAPTATAPTPTSPGPGPTAAAPVTTVVPLNPLPAGRAAFPDPERPFSPDTTELADGTVAAANFGVCSDQHSSYCPDPGAPTSRAHR